MDRLQAMRVFVSVVDLGSQSAAADHLDLSRPVVSRYLAELEDESGRRYLRISTPVGPLAGADPRRCLRFNWEQRTGYLAISDLEGSPYLHLCENRPYGLLTTTEIDRVIDELGALGDRMEQAISNGGDTF